MIFLELKGILFLATLALSLIVEFFMLNHCAAGGQKTKTLVATLIEFASTVIIAALALLILWLIDGKIFTTAAFWPIAILTATFRAFAALGIFSLFKIKLKKLSWLFWWIALLATTSLAALALRSLIREI